jgi:hypothetical protein
MREIPNAHVNPSKLPAFGNLEAVALDPSPPATGDVEAAPVGTDVTMTVGMRGVLV